MDKYEYKIRAEEIKELIAQGEYAHAAEIADTIDWRRVKSVMMLCTISDLYKINRRYEDARDMLLLAYERRPGGRTICYSLCELSIKMEEFVQAVEYYKEFVQIAPKDTGRYILQYKLYEAQDVSLEERIEVLEELKKRDYREKWAYELAYLYHRVGLATRCVEECDELILWFGEGKYVIKAMELKMLHQSLTESQQAKYDSRFGGNNVAYMPETEAMVQDGEENSVNDVAYDAMDVPMETPTQEDVFPYEAQSDIMNQDTKVFGEVPEVESEELDIQVKTMDVGQYNTINLQEELAAGLREVLEEECRAETIEDPITRSIVAPMMESDTESLDYPEIDEIDEEDMIEDTEEIESSEVFFGETGEIGDLNQVPRMEALPDVTGRIVMEQMREENSAPVEEPAMSESVMNEPIKSEPVINEPAQDEALTAEPPKELANVLSQESDGQISLVVPENENIEKQITGQMSIEDILLEWERMKKENEEKRKEEVRQHVLEQTGTMFTDFEVAVRDGLLERLESGAISAGEALAVADGIEEVDSTEDTEWIASEEYAEVGELAQEPEYVPEEECAEVEELAQEPEYVPEEEYAEVEELAQEPETTPSMERDKIATRSLTPEEKELFGAFIQSKSEKEQLIHVIDNISMASYTGNVIITGEEGVDTLSLAKNLVREVQANDSNFSGKVAKISGGALNNKDVVATIEQLKNGALIIQKAAQLDKNTVTTLYKCLEQENLGIIVILEDTKRFMNRFLSDHPVLNTCFTARMDVEALSNDALVAFGKKYAYEQEYAIDELGVLALHTRIEEMQTSDHVVTIAEVKEIVDEAIYHANKKTIGHFFDVLLSKRYDEEDMIILTEKDFA